MWGVRMLSVFLIGVLLIIAGEGTSVAKAKAASVSIIKLTHRS